MTTEVVEAFRAAMVSAGIEPAEPIDQQLMSGQRFYFRAGIDKPKQRKAWAVLYLDERPAGAFGHFKAGISERWRFEGAQPFSRDESLRLKRKIREEAAKREAAAVDRHKSAAALCMERWERAGEVDPGHAYLVSKGICGEGLRQEGRNLLVPMYDAAGVLWNLQTISPDGRKLFAKDGRLKGLHLLLGEPDGRLAVAEGYGTAAVVRRATGLPVAAAFCWTNLTATALAMHERFPTAEITIAADDDAHLADHPQIHRNIGLEAAHAAAQAVGGRVAVPPRSY